MLHILYQFTKIINMDFIWTKLSTIFLNIESIQILICINNWSSSIKEWYKHNLLDIDDKARSAIN